LLLVVLGGIFLILKDLRQTIGKANKILDTTDAITEGIQGPLSAVSSLVLGSSLIIIDCCRFVKNFLGHDKDEKKDTQGVNYMETIRIIWRIWTRLYARTTCWYRWNTSCHNQKRREIFRELTTKGLDKFSDLDKRLQETGAFEELMMKMIILRLPLRTLKTEAHPEEEDSVREVAQEEERAEKPVVKSHPPPSFSYPHIFLEGKKPKDYSRNIYFILKVKSMRFFVAGNIFSGRHGIICVDTNYFICCDGTTNSFFK